MSDMDTSLRLLAVEDDPTDRSWLELMLKDATACPYSMRFVGTMRDAETAVMAREYDCVLLDLSLPDCEGLESVRRVLAARPGMPIVVFTGRKDQEQGLGAIEVGAQDYLVKGQASGNTILQAARWAAARGRARRWGDANTGPSFDGLVEAWAILDLDLLVTQASPAFLQLIGMNETELLGRPITAVLEPDADTMARAWSKLVGLADSDAASMVESLNLWHRLGEAVPRTLVATPLRNEERNTEIDGLFVLFARPVAPTGSSA